MPKRIDRRDFLKTAGAAGLGLATAGILPTTASAQERKPSGGQSMLDYAAPRMEKVRFGVIGVGARGSGHVSQLLLLEGVEIPAIADNHVPTANNILGTFKTRNAPAPTLYTNGDTDYKRMLARDDIDAVLIATPWSWHARMAVDAMNAGKHVFLEVPAAITTEECWQLVDTSEKTRRHCMMMENVCYGREELMVLNMCRLGVFGELLHGEAAYIHDLRGQMHEIEHGTGSWRTLEYTKRNGNLYPTHGLGPVCQYMNINRGDRLDYLSSVSSPSRVRAIYARQKFPEGHARRNLKFVCGDINTTIVKTVRGKSIMIQWDEQLPRPYNRLNLIQGTRGVWGGFPDRVVIEGETKSTDSWTQRDDLAPIYEKYDHPLWKRMGEEAKRNGGHGGMDFIMLWRLVYCLRNGLPLDQDVYDAAAWSVITPLSEWSVANRSQSIDVPDFTRGKWRNAKPLEIVT
ncbi:MAG TPA: Gfo/Idh/MocA family oxidoreductase [Fimbriimonadaceae bacterium]|nr:Gfo/Idh/MocA family oxidoreductase [Fimbriimonadaceae bacterium]HRJ96433.1 Gfo/Idh/MocA family oxidoreductase [Fimbriimonadaceae bacterium]